MLILVTAPSSAKMVSLFGHLSYVDVAATSKMRGSGL